MTNSMLRIATALVLATTLASAAHAADAGSHIQLSALPEYVQRVFVPVVPQAANSLVIASLAAEKVVDVPPSFDVRVVKGKFVVYSDGGDAAVGGCGRGDATSLSRS
jgi:hypothetical protein